EACVPDLDHRAERVGARGRASVEHGGGEGQLLFRLGELRTSGGLRLSGCEYREELLLDLQRDLESLRHLAGRSGIHLRLARLHAEDALATIEEIEVEREAVPELPGC